MKYFVRNGNGNYRKMLLVPAELKRIELSISYIIHTSKGVYKVDDVVGDTVYLTIQK